LPCLQFQPYHDQVQAWPKAGRHILAQYDDDSIIVYQAFRPEIARHAVAHGAFGGESRAFFDVLLAKAVSSTFDPARYASRENWQEAITRSDVRLQWDPDHDPQGAPQSRRAIQLGLRGNLLEQFGKRELTEVIDLTLEVAEQRELLIADIAKLKTPTERVYRPQDETVAANIGLAP
jgi:uncharacterized protein DUF4291